MDERVKHEHIHIRKHTNREFSLLGELEVDFYLGECGHFLNQLNISEIFIFVNGIKAPPIYFRWFFFKKSNRNKSQRFWVTDIIDEKYMQIRSHAPYFKSLPSSFAQLIKLSAIRDSSNGLV